MVGIPKLTSFRGRQVASVADQMRLSCIYLVNSKNSASSWCAKSPIFVKSVQRNSILTSSTFLCLFNHKGRAPEIIVYIFKNFDGFQKSFMRKTNRTSSAHNRLYHMNKIIIRNSRNLFSQVSTVRRIFTCVRTQRAIGFIALEYF